MRLLSLLIGLIGFGGLIVLAIAGVTAATAILVTAFAIVAMIALGSLLGGRNTPNRAPYDPHAPARDTEAEENTGGGATGGSTEER